MYILLQISYFDFFDLEILPHFCTVRNISYNHEANTVESIHECLKNNLPKQ